jgi:CheY-like chemotaxis protein
MEPNPSIFRNIWLCDDDADDHGVFENALKEVLPACLLTSFFSACDLLAGLDHFIPDLIFLDINMPHINGQNCVKLVREKKNYAELPIIIYSGSDYSIDINISYGYGATLYLVKPKKYTTLVSQLTTLFQMDWGSYPEITAKHFVDNKYVPYSAE